MYPKQLRGNFMENIVYLERDVQRVCDEGVLLRHSTWRVELCGCLATGYQSSQLSYSLLLLTRGGG